jgi:hypothetical protein
MSDFGDIMRRGRKMFDMKSKGGTWNRCEECDTRALCYPYIDEKNEVWVLCEDCTNEFVKDEQ